MSKRKNFWDNMVVCPARKRIDQCVIEAYGEDFDNYPPKCEKCKVDLMEGDLLDNFYPYHEEMNLCVKCEGKNG